MSRKAVELSVSTHIMGQPVLSLKCLTSDVKAHENSIEALRELVSAGHLIVDPWERGDWWGLGQTFFL